MWPARRLRCGALGHRARADVRRTWVFSPPSSPVCWHQEAGTVSFEMMRAVLLAALLACAVASAAAGAPPWSAAPWTGASDARARRAPVRGGPRRVRADAGCSHRLAAGPTAGPRVRSPRASHAAHTILCRLPTKAVGCYQPGWAAARPSKESNAGGAEECPRSHGWHGHGHRHAAAAAAAAGESWPIGLLPTTHFKLHCCVRLVACVLMFNIALKPS